MNPNVQDFLDRINTAFESGDLSEANVLVDALAHLNYCDSAGENSFIEDALNTLDVNVIADLPIKPARCLGGFCNGPHFTDGYGPLFWVEDKNKFFRDRRANPRHNKWAIKRINALLSDPKVFKREILWLSDLDGTLPSSGTNAWKLLHELGYFGKDVKEKLLICQVNAGNLHKPTWVDAGFSFFWYAAPVAGDYGQTRSLRDGKPRFKEWVVKRETVKVENVEILSMGTVSGTPISDVTDLPREYLENCAREVNARRGNVSRRARR